MMSDETLVDRGTVALPEGRSYTMGASLDGRCMGVLLGARGQLSCVVASTRAAADELQDEAKAFGLGSLVDFVSYDELDEDA